MSSKPEKAVLLLAFGGAESEADIEPFIKNVLKGRPVTPELVEKAKERYRLIGGGSPLLKITMAQAGAVEEILNRDPEARFTYKSYVGMRYWKPFIKDALADIKKDGIGSAVAVIMAPFISRVATGGYDSDINDAVKELGGAPDVGFTKPFHINLRFIDLLAERINEQLGSFADRKEALVVFSNHSLPLSALEGDPYEMMIHQTVGEVLKKAGRFDYKVAFQSAGSGSRQWLEPRTEDVIIEAKKMGKKGVVLVPLGFVADHVETLYDIDILFKTTAASLGLIFKRCPSINTAPKFMELLADLVKKHTERL
ncbi:MAG: ferrochelatase [Deltaproteobacteria bacterium]|nr:ferrochelatase [Deltaproteobacteria bacterium]